MALAPKSNAFADSSSDERPGPNERRDSLTCRASSANWLTHLSPRLAFYLQASLIVSFLAGSSAPTPLYSTYQVAWGFSPITTTLVFGVYAFAVLAALLTAGSLSDYIGRRPVLLVASALQVVVMWIFAHSAGVSGLLAGRVVQGLSTGAAVGAIGAGLLDLDRVKGTLANAVGPVTGTAVGGIASGLIVEYLPAPTQLIYFVLLGVFVLQTLGVALMPETSARKEGALAALRPQFRVPRAARRPLLLATPALIAAWALAGFYGSLGPALVRGLAGSTSVVLGGITVFVLAGSGAVAVWLLRRRGEESLLTIGTASLAAGVGITLVAIGQSSLAAFFVGTALSGAGFGAGFQGAIRSVLPLAAPDERAGVLSVLYVVSYLSMGLPAILGGLLVVYGGGMLATAREFGLVVMFLAVIALVGTRTTARQKRLAIS
jgi:predicted MFS family arabinose efflux permease